MHSNEIICDSCSYESQKMCSIFANGGNVRLSSRCDKYIRMTYCEECEHYKYKDDNSIIYTIINMYFGMKQCYGPNGDVSCNNILKNCPDYLNKYLKKDRVTLNDYIVYLNNKNYKDDSISTDFKFRLPNYKS